MPKLSRNASKKAKQERMHEEMTKFKEGRLHSGSRTGPVVSDRAQAIAIGLSESGQSRQTKRKSTRRTSRGGRR